MQVAAGSHPRGGCISGTGDAGVIPAAGCFSQAVMGGPGPNFPFPSLWSRRQGLRLGTRGFRGPGAAPHTCILPAAGEGLGRAQHRQVPANSRAMSSLGAG